MAYEVLARKWRPDRFATMVGQEHVLRALIHALESDRLHHAYLFTGTRGVGKTTVARILARCLNCESGVGPEPCGTCSSCVEISEGRFVDLIEVDAASRTKVEDTRELLDNVQYAPTRGRYKVYLIDEVHMLSASSFNALLKTLEEPPPHVKFLLATTDPKKLPVTVLSRCLQFHLKNLTPERIVAHLEHVLGAEQVSFETPALWALAKAADGSMRDALSLTDQAVSHGGGRLEADDVARMLGTIDQGALERILTALADGDGDALIACCDDLAAHAADFTVVLKELMSALHHVAVAQALPDRAGGTVGGNDALLHLAPRLAPEDVQLCYQIALTGVRDLPWAPDARTGFEMTLLRMLAFRPLEPGGNSATDGGQRGAASGEAGSATAERTSAPSGSVASAEDAAERAERVEIEARTAIPPAVATTVMPAAATPTTPNPSAPSRGSADAAMRPPAEARVPQAAAGTNEARAPASAGVRVDAPTGMSAAPPAGASVGESRPKHAEAEVSCEASEAAVETPAPSAPPRLLMAEDWHQVLAALSLEGLTRELASHCLPSKIDGYRLELTLDPSAESLLADMHVTRLERSLAELLGGEWRLRISTGPCAGETPAALAARERAERQARAVAAIEDDVQVRRLREVFDARVQQESIRPRP